MRAIIIFITSLVLLAFNQANAQLQEPADKDFWIMGRMIENKPVIKIIPGNQGAWYLGMRQGYKISISEFKNDDFTPYFKLVENLKPASNSDFTNSDLPRGFAEPMRKMIYEENYVPSGQSFDDMIAVSEGMGSHFLAYFLFSTYNPKLSAMSGLQSNLSENLSSRFKIKIEIPGTKYVHEQIMNLSSFNVTYDSPDISVEQGDGNMKITWDHRKREMQFSAYVVERSSDGYTFDQIGLPRIFNEATKAGELGLISVTDSIPKNYATYWYRVNGYDAFGYISTPREAVAVYGRDMTPPEAPKRVQVTQTTEKEINVAWSSESSPDLAGFQVIAADSEKGIYHRMHEELLPPSRNSFDFTFTQEPLRFYRVLAVDTANNAAASDLGYLVVYDTIPPQIPTNIIATADTNHVVSVSWTPSPDKDLKGYRVYKAFHPSHGFIPITPVPITQPFYVDTLGDKRLEKKVYYQIVALDHHFNHSKPSEAVVADIPDIHAPTSPLLTHADLDEKSTVQLTWKASSSSDVESYEIMRRLDKDSAYAKIGNVKAGVFTYSDNNFSEIHVSFAEYHITATDSSGNISEASNGKRVLSKSDKSNKIEIKSATAQENQVKLSWNTPSKTDYNILVYRAENDGKFQLLDRVSGENTYSDKAVKAGAKYQYRIGVLGSDGYRSPLSKQVDVELK